MKSSKALMAGLMLGAMVCAGVTPAWSEAVPAIAAEKPAYVIKGFRTATFGMGAEPLLAAIKADFGVTADKVKIQANPADRTTTYTVTVDSLAPGPGPATITYTLGAQHQTLFQIGVLWVVPGEPTREERTGLLNDGVVLVNYFRAETWPANAAKVGVPIGPNALVLFAGRDASGGAVEVDLRGITYDRQQDGKTISSPPVSGPATLAVVYTADIDHPDVFKLAPGSF